MKAITILLLGLAGCSLNQRDYVAYGTTKTSSPTNIDTFRYEWKTAHINAQKVMNEEFLWSPIEETAPFGNDDGSNAAYGFLEWRQANTGKPVTIYLTDWLARTGYPKFDISSMDSIKIEKYLSTPLLKSESEILAQMKAMRSALTNAGDTSMQTISDAQLREIVVESSEDMGVTLLVNQDNAIIGITFAQFVLEGMIDKEMKELTLIAIKREQLPVLMRHWDKSYQSTRAKQLSILYKIIENVLAKNPAKYSHEVNVPPQTSENQYDGL